MKIFIGKIPADLDPDSIYNHFKTFGEVSNYNFKGQFAFVDYINENDGYKVLKNREHDINGQIVIVEMSSSKPKSRGDFDDRPPRSDYNDRPPRSDYNDRPLRSDNDVGKRDYQNNSYGYNDEYNKPRYGDYKPYPSRQYDDRGYDNYQKPAYYDESRRTDDYRKPSTRDDREDCPHCSRCEYHGNYKSRQDTFERKKPRREHPNDIHKIVIQNLPQNISIAEIDDFVKQKGFEIVFSRMTFKGDSAIVEMKDTSSRDEAIEKLNGLELNGVSILVREFRVSSTFSGSNNLNNYSEKNHGDSQGVDIYSGIDNFGKD